MKLCILGGGGTAEGVAFYDEISLVDQGLVDETTTDPLKHIIAHVAQFA